MKIAAISIIDVDEAIVFQYTQQPAVSGGQNPSNRELQFLARLPLDWVPHLCVCVCVDI